jgi:hypothetical protein
VTVQTFGDARAACPFFPGGAVGSAVPDTSTPRPNAVQTLVPSSRLGRGSGGNWMPHQCFTHSRAWGARNGAVRRFPPGHPNLLKENEHER